MNYTMSGQINGGIIFFNVANTKVRDAKSELLLKRLNTKGNKLFSEII